MSYNGHKNWNQWNVSLWINNEESLYRMAKDYVRAVGKKHAPRWIMDELYLAGVTHTPDGAKYNITSVRNALKSI